MNYQKFYSLILNFHLFPFVSISISLLKFPICSHIFTYSIRSFNTLITAFLKFSENSSIFAILAFGFFFWWWITFSCFFVSYFWFNARPCILKSWFCRLSCFLLGCEWLFLLTSYLVVILIWLCVCMCVCVPVCVFVFPFICRSDFATVNLIYSFKVMTVNGIAIFT